jgi:large exoprotein involved in heme utilization and adhesion
LSVDAQDVQIIATSADGQSRTALRAYAERDSKGDAGNLTLKANTLVVRDGAAVSTATFGAGNGGDLRIDAQDVQLIGTSADGGFPSGLFASTEANSTGDAGNLTIKTNTMLVRDGAYIVTATRGAGKGGDLSVDAQDVQIIGKSTDSQSPTGLFTNANPNSTGDAGDLTIKTNTMLVRNGAQVGTGTFSAGKGGDLRIDAQDVQIIGTSADGGFPSGLFASVNPNSTGDAGDLTIKTNTLLVRDGAQILTATFGTGKGGFLSVDAQDVQLIGSGSANRFTALVAGARDSTGDAGDLTIKTNTMLVRDGAGVIVESRGTGTAGNMTLYARSIRLDNDGSLSADTRSALVDPNREQATININSQDLIITRNSNITTNATGANVFGGNIRINTDNLVAVPKENSDITANSQDFRGGNVTVRASGIFGIEFREQPTALSDITATGVSEEFRGTVELITPGIDPARGLAQLPTEVVDASDEIAQGCPAAEGNSFVATGRGGLPPTPEQQLDDDAEWLDRRRLTVAQQTPHPTPHTSTDRISNPRSHTPIIEATGWQMTPTGKVILFASTPDSTVPHSLNQLVTCPGR